MITALNEAALGIGRSIVTSTQAVTSWAEARWMKSWYSGVARFAGEKARQTASRRVMGEGEVAVGTQLSLQSEATTGAENSVPAANLSTTVTDAIMLSEQGAVVRSKISAADAKFTANYFASGGTDAGVVIERHKPYCSQSDVMKERCGKAASSSLQDADLLVNTILNPGEGQYETLADDERDAGTAFMTNVVNPIPVQRFLGGKATSAQEKAYEAAMMADQAALSMAAHSFNAIMANRTRRHQQ